MKYLKYVYVLLISSVVLFWAIYFIKRNRKVSRDDAKTELSISNKIVNNGKSKHRDPVTAVFELTNTGNHPLIIQDVKTDCNCTVPNWEHNPILPQQKTKIELQYNGTTMGYYQKKATVYCNVENSPILLILRGNIVVE